MSDDNAKRPLQTTKTNACPADISGRSTPEFTHDEVEAIADAVRSGNEIEARRIVESKNLTWLDSLVEKSQLGL